jgi:hypothetical protein
LVGLASSTPPYRLFKRYNETASQPVMKSGGKPPHSKVSL